MLKHITFILISSQIEFISHFKYSYRSKNNGAYTDNITGTFLILHKYIIMVT